MKRDSKILVVEVCELPLITLQREFLIRALNPNFPDGTRDTIWTYMKDPIASYTTIVEAIQKKYKDYFFSEEYNKHFQKIEKIVVKEAILNPTDKILEEIDIKGK